MCIQKQEVRITTCIAFTIRIINIRFEICHNYSFQQSALGQSAVIATFCEDQTKLMQRAQSRITEYPDVTG